MPRGTGVLGVDVAIEALPTSELQVDPTGPFLVGTGLRPSEAEGASGVVTVRNQTGSTLNLRVRGVPATGQLDETLALELSTDGAVLFDGVLGELREWTPSSFSIGPGQSVAVTAHASVLPSAGGTGSYRLIEDVMLEFLTEAQG
jgi:hypothetical protein